MKKISVSKDSTSIIPGFSLPEAGGGHAAGPRDFKQQNNLVILFLHSEDCDRCRKLLDTLGKAAAKMAALNSRILAVVSEVSGEAAGASAARAGGIIMLLDLSGKVTEQYGSFCRGASPPFIVMADRFGAFFGCLDLEEEAVEDEREIIQELESTLLFIETQCPECGRPFLA